MLLIVYGSLYPWQFAPAHLTASPLWILLHAWQVPGPRYFIRDFIVNVALYTPLGFAAHLAFRGSRWPGFPYYGPLLLGLVLSVAMELTQLLEPVRTTSMLDVVTNVIGTVCGLMLARLFEAVPRVSLFQTNDRSALVLVFCWGAWLVFPLFPAFSLYQLTHRLAEFEQAQVFDVVPLVSSAAAWVAAGFLIEAAGLRISRARFGLTLLVIPAQFLIASRQPVPSAWLGAAAGVVLFAAVSQTEWGAKAAAWSFLLVIVVRGLAPFRFAAEPAVFNWVPFSGLLNGEWQDADLVLIEKIFFYGAAIWLLRAAGVRLMWSVALVAAVLASIEAVQVRLPGRTPEIADPILAILMGFVLAMFSRETKTRFQSAG